MGSLGKANILASENPLPQLRLRGLGKVMGIIGSPWLNDILMVLIDRLNDSLPAESKLPSLLE